MACTVLSLIILGFKNVQFPIFYFIFFFKKKKKHIAPCAVSSVHACNLAVLSLVHFLPHVL